ncbi:MAG TPA: NADH-quinone oxidoreductase subunit C [Syntrophomonadaceae bacterium]|nr:NADH-quinone oxidoreductase subunit C [Syntrophomonadaceae bacterium]
MNKREEMIKRLSECENVIIKNVEGTNQRQIGLTVDKDSILKFTEHVFKKLKGRIVNIIATDRTQITGKYDLTYIYNFQAEDVVLLVRVEIDPADPRVDSISGIIPGAIWFEREFKDMMGIVPVNHPDPRRLILADDWPEGLHPLRKDFPYNFKPPKVEFAKPDVKPVPGEATVVNVGPFFPTLEEPAYFRLFVEGEKIVGADYRGFYSHRGIEKLADTTLDYNQIPFLAERICGICGFVHSCGYCQAVEAAAEIEIPERAKYIRTIMLELERIHSHLLWLGLAGHIIGFDTILMQSWRVREPVMWLTEKITGNRKTYGMNLVGGVRRDIPNEMHDEILQILAKVEQETKKIVDAIVGDTTLKMRLQNVGVMNREEARDFCVIGPTARGSGLAIDNRKMNPYAAYDKMEFDIAVHDEGDIWSRTLVRVEELFTAISIIRQAIEKIPEGPLMAENTEVPPGREGVALLEAPRGECCHYVRTGDGKPERWAVRAPTYMQLNGIHVMFEGESLADAPIIVGSIDPCFSCTERMETVDVSSKEIKILSGEKLAEEWQKKNRGGETVD